MGCVITRRDLDVRQVQYFAASEVALSAGDMWLHRLAGAYVTSDVSARAIAARFNRLARAQDLSVIFRAEEYAVAANI